MKALVTAPYVGEIGWELMAWQGQVRRAFADVGFDRLVVLGSMQQYQAYLKRLEINIHSPACFIREDNLVVAGSELSRLAAQLAEISGVFRTLPVPPGRRAISIYSRLVPTRMYGFDDERDPAE